MIHLLLDATLVAPGFLMVFELISAWGFMSKPGLRRDRVKHVGWALVGGSVSLGVAFVIGVFVLGLSASTVSWLAGVGVVGAVVMLAVGPPVMGLMDRLDCHWGALEERRDPDGPASPSSRPGVPPESAAAVAP